MLRSMYSGISGMKVNQTKLDVIGNNISNVGTTGFKSSRARFSDMLNQNVSDAMAPSQNQGGVNASQVGLGVQLASIDSVMTQGMMQPTGRSLDVAIDGEGFFMVSKGPTLYGDGQLEVNHRPGTHTITEQSLANSGSELMYSRDGSFILDNEGNLLTGDGYRVMGYSLTNDDSSMGASAVSPNPAEIQGVGLDFRFGPGSQLNGYKVVLGTVGPQTPTSADVDKKSKLIILNGDFSTPGALTVSQVESALNKGLSANGISQSISVSGKINTIANLGSDSISGGTSATSPDTLAFAGFKIAFSDGSALNGYTFEIGEVAADEINAEVKPDVNKIIINADFVNKSSITQNGLKEAINLALAEAKIEQTVTNVTGSAINIGQIYDKAGTSVIPKAPNLKDKDGKDVVAGSKYFGGFEVSVGEGSALNGYSLEFGDETGELKVSVDTTDRRIRIHGDMNNYTDAEINTKITNALKNVGIREQTITLSGSYVEANRTNKINLDKEGTDAKQPDKLNVGGFTIEFPKLKGNSASPFDEFEFVIVDVNSTDLEVNVDGKRVEISGDFKSSKSVNRKDLEKAINDKLKAAGIQEEITVSGSSKINSGLTSEQITGGAEDKAPKSFSALGYDFVFGPGDKLNGYKLQIGKITAGTKTEAIIDEKNGVISINGDFVTKGAVDAKMIESALSNALKGKGIEQDIEVTKGPLYIENTESDETFGGTPVQSIDGDGTINFVDGTKDLKSYDGTLKTLKIPDKVRIPGTDTELRVKTYTIDSTGVINGVLEDGRVAALGQIAMASFKNPEGLTKMGGNLYSGSVNSGNPIIKSGVGTLGEDNSKGYGDNLQGMLEMSNVDLAEQFTDMIVSSRAFQASGKMITTGDEILQDIINLKR
ncbi:flagellar hook-basal body complex protein [Clostridium paraputrificum]|uniref:flagellar hook-basal body complex protein n=1 Tax=Clostridium paraputrificum TaxID=29363 RepID=UPI003D3320CB